jgi:hypothetical protein
MLAARLWLTPCDPPMPIDQSFPADRTALTNLLFPAGVPLLWSPTLVFYDEAGHIDCDRQLTHLALMAPHDFCRNAATSGSSRRHGEGMAWRKGPPRNALRKLSISA